MGRYRHIHILGAPGSGVTTLGKALAERLGFFHFDTDDYVWFTDDDLPFRRKRNVEHRRKLMERDLTDSDAWVLSGAVCGWGDVFASRFDLVAHLGLPTALRLARIQEREVRRYGQERLSEGGDLHLVYEKFMAWAERYDFENDNIRNRASELRWLEQLACPVLKFEDDAPVENWVETILQFMDL